IRPESVARLALRWDFEAGSGITGTPAVVGERVVVGSWDGRVYALERASGKRLWTFEAGTRGYPPDRRLGISASPAVSGGSVFVATGKPFHLMAGNLAYSSSVIVLDAASGALRWADQVHPHDTRNLDLNCPPMLLRDRGGKRLLVVGGKDGIRAWDRETRKRLWHVQLTPARPPAGGEALPTTGPEAGPTAAAGGLVFFASNNHADKGCAVAALDAGSGEIRWLHFLPAFQLGPLSVAGGVVFLGLTDGKLRAWSAAEAALLWESPAGPA